MFFQAFSFKLSYLYVLSGVGKKVRTRELMDIASPEENDNHVISVREYKTLQEAIKRAVYIKIGM